MTAIIVVIVLVYLAFHLGTGHAHYRHRKAHGLSPNFYWSSVRGPYASVLVHGQRVHVTHFSAIIPVELAALYGPGRGPHRPLQRASAARS